IAALDAVEGGEARWRLALAGIDRLLDDLGLDRAGKQAVMEEVQRRHFAVAPALAPALVARLALYRDELGALIDPSGAAEHPLAPGLAIFGRRSERVRPLADQLRAHERAGRLSRTVRA